MAVDDAASDGDGLPLFDAALPEGELSDVALLDGESTAGADGLPIDGDGLGGDGTPVEPEVAQPTVRAAATKRLGIWEEVRNMGLHLLGIEVYRGAKTRFAPLIFNAKTIPNPWPRLLKALPRLLKALGRA